MSTHNHSNNVLQGTRYGAALEGAARDAAQRAAVKNQPDPYEKMLLHRYVRQIARSQEAELTLTRMQREAAEVSDLSTGAWAFLQEAKEHGTFAVGRGMGPTAKALTDRHLAEMVRPGLYRLTEAGDRLARGQKEGAG